MGREPGTGNGVIVIGAGMVGLVAALRLARSGTYVTVLERDAVPGGLASSFVPTSGFDRLERFYHHIFRSDRTMIRLLDEVGLSDALVWAEPVTACFHDDGMRRLDSARSLLAFDRLPVVSRLRLATVLAFLKLMPTSDRLEQVEATRWLRRYAGDSAYDEIFAPLFDSKFGKRADQVSLAWFWARIHDRTASLGYITGGFARLYDRLVDEIRVHGGTVHFGHSVRTIEHTSYGFDLLVDVDCDGPVAFSGATVIATIPSPLLGRICARFESHDLASSQPGISARCLIVALDRPLTGTYWINMCHANAPFMVAVEHTALVAPDHYGGAHLLYLGEYGDDLGNETAAQLLERFAPTLKKLNAAFDASWVRGTWLFSAPYAQPLVTTTYRDHIPPIETTIPGLYLANLYQVFPHDRGQNYAIELAERVVGLYRRAIPDELRASELPSALSVGYESRI